MRQKHIIQEFDGIRFYKKPNGYFKADWVKMGSRTIFMHRYVWEKHYGEIPPDHHIHHINGDKSDNRIENLECVVAHKHLSMHAKELKFDPRCVAGLEKAREAAKAWHGSEEGRKWHSEHGKNTWKGRAMVRFQCTQCGKDYEGIEGTRKKGVGFCSGYCKTKHRIESGVDDETRICVQCGSDFVINRYKKKITCSKACTSQRISKSRSGVRHHSRR